MKTGTSQHPKTADLCHRLQIDTCLAVGVLNCLWEFACDYAPQGNIGKWTDTQIAGSIGWKGDAGQLINSLVDSRWVDRDEEHRLLIHDWSEHAPHYVKERLRRQGLAIIGAKRSKTEQNGEKIAYKAGLGRAGQGKARQGKTHIGAAQSSCACVEAISEPKAAPEAPGAPQPLPDNQNAATGQQPASAGATEDDFSIRFDPAHQKARDAMTSAWKDARAAAGLPQAIDGNGRRGLDVLASGIARGDYTTEAAARAMRKFIVEQRTDPKLSGYGLHGFSQNISRWLPHDKPRPVAPAAVTEKAKPPPTTEELVKMRDRAWATGQIAMANQITKMLESKCQPVGAVESRSAASG